MAGSEDQGTCSLEPLTCSRCFLYLFLSASAGINCFVASVVLSLPGEHMASLILSIFSSGAGGSQMLKGYYETLRRGQSGSYLLSCGW